MKSPERFQSGDIILTDRGLYQHYGIYAGKGRVIHYAAENGDFGINIGVRETSLNDFALNGKCRVVYIAGNNIWAKKYSRKETVQRARSRLGEKHYNLVFNNCEHFAFWCKTGLSKSAQVEKAFCAIAVLTAAIVITKLAVDSNNDG